MDWFDWILLHICMLLPLRSTNQLQYGHVQSIPWTRYIALWLDIDPESSAHPISETIQKSKHKRINHKSILKYSNSV